MKTILDITSTHDAIGRKIEGVNLLDIFIYIQSNPWIVLRFQDSNKVITIFILWRSSRTLHDYQTMRCYLIPTITIRPQLS